MFNSYRDRNLFRVMPQQFYDEGTLPNTTPPNTTPPKTFTQEEVNALMGGERAALREKYKGADAVAAELAALKAGQMTELQKVEARAKAAETKAAAAEAKVEAAALKDLKVAALEKAGLLATFAGRIGGTDAATIAADVKELQTLLGGTKVGGGTTPADKNTSAPNAAMNTFIRQGAGKA